MLLWVCSQHRVGKHPTSRPFPPELTHTFAEQRLEAAQPLWTRSGPEAACGRRSHLAGLQHVSPRFHLLRHQLNASRTTAARSPPALQNDQKSGEPARRARIAPPEAAPPAPRGPTAPPPLRNRAQHRPRDAAPLPAAGGHRREENGGPPPPGPAHRLYPCRTCARPPGATAARSRSDPAAGPPPPPAARPPRGSGRRLPPAGPRPPPPRRARRPRSARTRPRGARPRAAPAAGAPWPFPEGEASGRGVAAAGAQRASRVGARAARARGSIAPLRSAPAAPSRAAHPGAEAATGGGTAPLRPAPLRLHPEERRGPPGVAAARGRPRSVVQPRLKGSPSRNAPQSPLWIVLLTRLPLKACFRWAHGAPGRPKHADGIVPLKWMRTFKMAWRALGARQARGTDKGLISILNVTPVGRCSPEPKALLSISPHRCLHQLFATLSFLMFLFAICFLYKWY